MANPNPNEEKALPNEQGATTLRRSEAILAAVSFAAECFLRDSNWRASLSTVLARLAAATAVSHIYVFEQGSAANDSVDPQASYWLEWSAETATLKRAHPHELTETQAVLYWKDILNQDQLIIVQATDATASERALLAAGGLHSLILIPIFAGNSWWGTIGFANTDESQTWSSAEQDALRAAAAILGAAVQNDRVTAALRASQEQFNAILAHSPIPIWGKDRAGRYLVWGQRSSTDIVYPIFDVVGLTDEELFTPERAADHRASDQAVLATGQPFSYETQVQRDGQMLYHQVTKFPLCHPDGTPYAVYGLAVNVTATRRAEEQQRLLAEASRQLSLSLNYEESLITLARLLVKDLADWCSVSVIDAKGLPRPITIACADPALQPLVDELTAYAMNPTSPYGYIAVLRSGRTQFFAEVPEDYPEQVATSARHCTLLRQAGHRSMITAPLVARDRVLGAITLTMAGSERRFSAADLPFVEELVRRAALAVDNSLLYQSASRRLIEMTIVQQIARTINSSLQLDEVLHAVVAEISRAFRYPMISIFLRDGDSLMLKAHTGYDEVISHLHISQGVVGRAIRSGETIYVENTKADPDFIGASNDIEQGIFVPLCRGDGTSLGVLVVEAGATPKFSGDDVALLHLLAAQVTIAVDNARLYQEAQVVLRNLDESVALLDALFERSPIGMAFLDRELRYQRVNEALIALNHQPRERHIGQSIRTILGPHGTELENQLRSVIASGEPMLNVELNDLQRHFDSQQSMLMTAYPVRLPDGQMLGVGVALTDISERKQAEEERLALERKLLETQRLESLGVMAGGIAHDFNNLLMAMLGHASLARQEIDLGSPVAHSLAQIELAARRAAELTHQMLAYAGRARVVVEPIDLNSAISEIAELLRTSVGRRVRFRLNLTPALPAVVADSAQMRQVIMNLVINAAEAIGERDGAIVLTTTRCRADALPLAADARTHLTGDYIALRVDDNGIGMDAETITKIFEPFFTTKFTGRGLGLAAVQGIIRAHHGVLLVDSAPGCGTTMTVLLPASQVEIAATELLAPPDPEANLALVAPSGLLVLVIDDEEAILSVTSAMLKHLGYRVLASHDSTLGLSLFHEHSASISCVLLDMTMPGLDGPALLNAMRAERSDLPMVLMSGFAAEDLAEQLRGREPNAYLHKPFTTQQLRAVISQALAG